MLNLLWVDGDPDAWSFARDILTDAGCAVEIVPEASGPIRARQATFDLIIMGIESQTEGDGLHVLRDLQALGIRTPVLVLSQSGNAALAFEAGHLGAVAFAQKPLVAAELIAAIHKATTNRAISVTDGHGLPRTHGVGLAPVTLRRPSAERLARIALAVCQHPSDWRSLRALAEIAGVGFGTVRAWCDSARISGMSFNRFCRVFRAVHLAAQTGVRTADLLDVIEDDTLTALFRAAGIEKGETSLETYCSRQAFLAMDTQIAEIALALLHTR